MPAEGGHSSRLARARMRMPDCAGPQAAGYAYPSWSAAAEITAGEHPCLRGRAWLFKKGSLEGRDSLIEIAILDIVTVAVSNQPRGAEKAFGSEQPVIEGVLGEAWKSERLRNLCQPGGMVLEKTGKDDPTGCRRFSLSRQAVSWGSEVRDSTLSRFRV